MQSNPEVALIGDFDTYLPTGFWLVDFQVCCPNCNATLNAVRVSIQDNARPTDGIKVLCEQCHVHWEAPYHGPRQTIRVTFCNPVMFQASLMDHQIHSTLLGLIRRALVGPVVPPKSTSNRSRRGGATKYWSRVLKKSQYRVTEAMKHLQIRRKKNIKETRKDIESSTLIPSVFDATESPSGLKRGKARARDSMSSIDNMIRSYESTAYKTETKKGASSKSAQDRAYDPERSTSKDQSTAKYDGSGREKQHLRANLEMSYKRSKSEQSIASERREKAGRLVDPSRQAQKVLPRSVDELEAEQRAAV